MDWKDNSNKLKSAWPKGGNPNSDQKSLISNKLFPIIKEKNKNCRIPSRTFPDLSKIKKWILTIKPQKESPNFKTKSPSSHNNWNTLPKTSGSKAKKWTECDSKLKGSTTLSGLKLRSQGTTKQKSQNSNLPPNPNSVNSNQTSPWLPEKTKTTRSTWSNMKTASRNFMVNSRDFKT